MSSFDPSNLPISYFFKNNHLLHNNALYGKIKVLLVTVMPIVSMPHIHVVPVILSGAFYDASFDDQLRQMEIHIRFICGELSKMKEQTEKWMIAWHEYGLTNGPDRYITPTQKRQFQKVMQDLTRNYYPKLTIVGGTVATKRMIDKDPAKRQKKIAEIKSAYETNQNLISYDIMRYYDESILSLDEFFLVRNTAYVFSKDGIKRFDKRIPAEETNSLDNSIFIPGVPGIGKNELAVQICLDHNVLVEDLTFKPLIQMIVSNTTFCDPQRCFSPYVIQIDSTQPLLFLTDIPKEKLEVIVTSYDMFTGRLVPITPQTLKHYTLRNLQRNITESIIDLSSSSISDQMESFKSLLLNHQNQHIVDPGDYLALIKFILEKYEILLARNFASAVLLLLINHANGNPQFINFQEYLTKLIEMEDTTFVIELSQPSYDSETIKKLNENIHIMIETLLRLSPDMIGSSRDDYRQSLKTIYGLDESKKTLNQLTRIHGQIQIDLIGKQRQIRCDAEEKATILFDSSALITNVFDTRMRFNNVMGLIIKCKASSDIEDYEKLQITLTIYQHVARDFSLTLPKPSNASDNNLGHYIDLCYEAELALKNSDKFLARASLNTIKNKAREELLVTGTFDSSGFKNFISDCTNTSSPHSQFYPKKMISNILNKMAHLGTPKSEKLNV